MKLRIEHLAVETVIGVYAWERQIKQTLKVDLVAEIPTPPAGSDALSDVMDYAALSEAVTAWFAQQEFALLERLITAFLTFLSQKWPDVAFDVVIHKPGAIKNAKDLSLAASTRA